jgi:hypothetical protein
MPRRRTDGIGMSASSGSFSRNAAGTAATIFLSNDWKTRAPSAVRTLLRNEKLAQNQSISAIVLGLRARSFAFGYWSTFSLQLCHARVACWR